LETLYLNLRFELYVWAWSLGLGAWGLGLGYLGFGFGFGFYAVDLNRVLYSVFKIMSATGWSAMEGA